MVSSYWYVHLDCLSYRPLMVSTQRLTSLAYNIVDGRSDDDKLSANIRPYVVKYVVVVLIYLQMIV